ncbi:hypothetical protein BH11PLA1_BH11PLA1_03250 [soil metagenome]
MVAAAGLLAVAGVLAVKVLLPRDAADASRADGVRSVALAPPAAPPFIDPLDQPVPHDIAPVSASPAPTASTPLPSIAAPLPTHPIAAPKAAPSGVTNPAAGANDAAWSSPAVRLSPVLVRIRTDLGNGLIETREGTGVSLGGGRILTASHVINQFTTIEIVFVEAQPTENAAAGGVASFSAARSAAVALDTAKSRVLSFPRYDVSIITGVAAPAWAVGAALAATHPALGDATLAVGLTGALDRRERRGPVVDTRAIGNAFLTDAPTRKGDSGGPVFNARGELIGIHSAQVSGTFTRADGTTHDRVLSAAYDITALPGEPGFPK